ncbi:hypothetical protein ABTY53_20005 [Streptomyces noursei]|uniref:hypothetical protein n=1 Tax=Streptomyces noursei TaxID=1971 RepID=UPI0033325975
MPQALSSYADADAERIDGGRVPIKNLDPVTPGPALTTERFAPVLAALELAGDMGQFIDGAVRTANEEFTGALGVNLGVPVRIRHQPQTAAVTRRGRRRGSRTGGSVAGASWWPTRGRA